MAPPHAVRFGEHGDCGFGVRSGFGPGIWVRQAAAFAEEEKKPQIIIPATKNIFVFLRHFIYINYIKKVLETAWITNTFCG
jgi:hypothetical protein